MPRHNPDHRSPAQFRTMREAAGITRADLAHRLEVSPKSVRAWDLHVTAPQAAWDIVDRQSRWITATIQTALDGLEDIDTEHGDQIEDIELTVYATDASATRAGIDMPAAWHRAGVAALAHTLTMAGYHCTITYAPQEP